MIISGTKALYDHHMKDKECQKIYDKARVIEPLITKDMENIAEELGGKLDGLKYSVKEASHVEKKLEQKAAKQITKQGFAQSNVENMENVGDLVRYTFLSKAYDIPNNTKSFISELEKKGYVITEVDNKYINPHPDTGYKGIHINAISPTKQKFELQIHSEKSLEVKHRGHSVYKRMQDVNTPESKKPRLAEAVRRIHSEVKNPVGIENIKSFKLNPSLVLDEMNKNNKYNYKVSTDRKINEDGNMELNSIISKDGVDIENRREVYKKDGNITVEEKITDGNMETYQSFTIDKEGKIVKETESEKDLSSADSINFADILNIIGDPPEEEPDKDIMESLGEKKEETVAIKDEMEECACELNMDDEEWDL